MILTNASSKIDKEKYKKEILKNAKKIDPKLLTRENIRKNKDLLHTSEDHIVRLFGSFANFKKELGLKTFFKTDEDIILAVQLVCVKLGNPRISREEYLKNKEEEDPSATAQYNFIAKNKLKGYSDFIRYCVEYESEFSNDFTADRFDKRKKEITTNEIKLLLSKGYYDTEIGEILNISPSVVGRIRTSEGIESNYKKDLEEMKRG